MSSDVDDLEDIRELPRCIRESQCVLIFLSRGYFASKACRGELESAIKEDKPLALVHEEDTSHGGATLDELRKEFAHQT